MTASASEVLPMSMIEALGSGLPLLAARSPAAEDLIDGHNGIISEGTAEALARALLSALDPARLPQMRRAALLSARSYDLPQRAAELAGIYEELLSGRKSRAP